MGFFDRFFRRTTTTVASQPAKREVFVGASNERDEQVVQSFSNSNITFSGELSGYDYDSILRNKQDNIVSLYQIADYYTDADPIIRGIIKHVYVPFSSCSPWYLTGSKKKTYALYEEQYKRMRLREKIDGIFLELWKYSNVCIYLFDGNIITLPVNRWKIGNITLNGQPIVDFDCQSILNEWRAKSYAVKENWIKDNNLEVYFKGYPPEIQEGLNKGEQYVQLNPENTFVFQTSKESWQRYAIPFIASCLSSLAKKELISKYEDAILNLATRSFVHVRYGDEKQNADILPDETEIRQVRKLFQQGMSGFPLVTTNYLAKAEVVQPKLDDLFQWDKYKQVNNDILSAGGVSGVIVSGVSEDGSTFASAQVSMETVEARINSVRDEFCELMTQINKRLTEYIPNTYNLKDVPEFHFAPLSMEGKKALREKCNELWQNGVVSTQTMMETNGYSIDLEKERREKEASDGTDEVLQMRNQKSGTQSDSNQKEGRPELDDSERTSDPDAAQRGKQPKPSNPEGSMDNTG
jgi:hypothetical protein